jgi:hypothetical protein
MEKRSVDERKPSVARVHSGEVVQAIFKTYHEEIKGL